MICVLGQFDVLRLSLFGIKTYTCTYSFTNYFKATYTCCP